MTTNLTGVASTRLPLSTVKVQKSLLEDALQELLEQKDGQYSYCFHLSIPTFYSVSKEFAK